uniref:Uncharacterized protein n=1 Tax=Physcomitrium patens TaxID=3218 RepID=A0A2K1L9H1_PHYPA|nr:hypothetical protein PHYPA_001103 [Physcomitrium patens]
MWWASAPLQLKPMLRFLYWKSISEAFQVRAWSADVMYQGVDGCAWVCTWASLMQREGTTMVIVMLAVIAVIEGHLARTGKNKKLSTSVMRLYDSPTPNVERAILTFFQVVVLKADEQLELVAVDLMSQQHKQPNQPMYTLKHVSLIAYFTVNNNPTLEVLYLKY